MAYPLLILLIGWLVSCAPAQTAEESLAAILDRVEAGDFDGLEERAPVLYALDEAGREEAARVLETYGGKGVTVESAPREWGRRTLFLTPPGGGGKTLVVTLARKNRTWILQDRISFKQNYAFIPLEKGED